MEKLIYQWSTVEADLVIFSRAVVAIATFLFGITTASGFYAQMVVIVRYIVGDFKLKDNLLKIYKWTYPLPRLVLVIISEVFRYSGSSVWLFSDSTTALHIFANIIALIIPAPKFVELLKDYKARFMGIDKVDPNIWVFFEEEEKHPSPQRARKRADGGQALRITGNAFLAKARNIKSMLSYCGNLSLTLKKTGSHRHLSYKCDVRKFINYFKNCIVYCDIVEKYS